MSLIIALANTFQVTEFDVLFALIILITGAISYYYITLHSLFEVAFWAIVGLGIYILLSVLLLGNAPIGSQGGLFPFWFSVFVISIAIYLIFILAILFPIHGGLIIHEPTHPTLYSLIYFGTYIFLFLSLSSVLIYMTEQVYIFRVGTVFVWLKDTEYYLTIVRNSIIFWYVISNQDYIIPLGVLLMLYKLLLSNLVQAAVLSVWYNLSHVGFYRKKEDSHYRVEFHEVGGHAAAGHDDHSAGHDDHGHGSSHDDHGQGHGSSHWHH
jgi:hypothetical protein